MDFIKTKCIQSIITAKKTHLLQTSCIPYSSSGPHLRGFAEGSARFGFRGSAPKLALEVSIFFSCVLYELHYYKRGLRCMGSFPTRA
jgi:hypothetical protein